ncbi:hypothetical protein U14_05045 [Candidatus Moduliflexus flocculans]|uniref:Uncharacterized protein n=1 Tax=Candidatus Moduliflexus flocculans TaxID=1499966 RepID=A0A081BQU0_9BACT|nr:hypothetical protein U14_05045 [Candidatus Moduliflexus flocculans]
MAREPVSFQNINFDRAGLRQFRHPLANQIFLPCHVQGRQIGRRGNKEQNPQRQRDDERRDFFI